MASNNQKDMRLKEHNPVAGKGVPAHVKATEASTVTHSQLKAHSAAVKQSKGQK